MGSNASPRWWLTLALVLTLGGCASLGASPETPGVSDYEHHVATGWQHARMGRVDEAVAAFERAAVADPARKEPWLQIAQLRLQQGRHVQALAAADQALQRDPSDFIAHDVAIASGMQVARQTMQRLRAAGAEPNEARRAQATELAQLMGEVFGPETLVPEAVRKEWEQRVRAKCPAGAPVLPATPEEPRKRPLHPLDVLGDG